MKTKVLSIDSIQGTQDFRVLICVGNDQQEFIFTVDTSPNDPFIVVGGDRQFGQLFRFNQHLAAQVGELVADVYYQKAVDLPLEVGYFFTPEEAIAEQKEFHLHKITCS
jgi:hypothetical protein